MLPFMAIMSAGTQMLGGILQAGEITRATEARMRQMRLVAAQEIGAYQAAVGGTGVEATSSTIQSHLNRMKINFDTAIRDVGVGGQAAANNSIIAAGGSAMASLGKNLYEASKVTDALGEKPKDPFDPGPLAPPTKRNPITWSW